MTFIVVFNVIKVLEKTRLSNRNFISKIQWVEAVPSEVYTNLQIQKYVFSQSGLGNNT